MNFGSFFIFIRYYESLWKVKFFKVKYEVFKGFLDVRIIVFMSVIFGFNLGNFLKGGRIIVRCLVGI